MKELDFRTWLLTESQKTRLVFFDFDKTLAHTPERPENWDSPPVGPKGKKYDWWTHPHSLSEPLYSGELNPYVKKEFMAAKNDPGTDVALLTGRVGMRVAPLVRGHLQKHGLYGKRVIAPSHTKAIRRQEEEDPSHPREQHSDAHEEYYKNDFRTEPDYPKTAQGKPSSDTLDHKRYIVNRKMHDGIREIDFWDDRENHLQPFLEMFKDLMKRWDNLQEIRLHHVRHDDAHILQHTLNRENPEWQVKQIPIPKKSSLW